MRHPSLLVSPEHCSQTTPISKFPVLCLHYSLMQESDPVAHWFPQSKPQISDAHLMLLPTLSKSQGWNRSLLPSPFPLKGITIHFLLVCVLPHGQGKRGAALVCVCISWKKFFCQRSPTNYSLRHKKERSRSQLRFRCEHTVIKDLGTKDNYTLLQPSLLL